MEKATPLGVTQGDCRMSPLFRPHSRTREKRNKTAYSTLLECANPWGHGRHDTELAIKTGHNFDRSRRA
jgi:hypothetical protein